jgi:hypothetical protein
MTYPLPTEPLKLHTATRISTIWRPMEGVEGDTAYNEARWRRGCSWERLRERVPVGIELLSWAFKVRAKRDWITANYSIW